MIALPNWFSFMTKSHEEEDSTTWLNRVINELANPLDSMPIATMIISMHHLNVEQN